MNTPAVSLLNKYVIQVSLIVLFLLQGDSTLKAQSEDLLRYVNPLIGTGASDVYTRWGKEGGTYPGAAASWGMFQLSPETKLNGSYDYADSAVYYFSCMYHHSGFPSGSTGRVWIMPLAEQWKPGYNRTFKHTDEQASPGYYRIGFADGKTNVQATVTTHAGIFRFAYPPNVKPRILVADAGKLILHSNLIVEGKGRNSVAIRFDKPWADTMSCAGGYEFDFNASSEDSTILTLSISASSLGFEQASANLDAVLGNKSFHEIAQQTAADWQQLLSHIQVADDSFGEKTKFYTALYHSLLLPWIVSDVDGSYRGADGNKHYTRGSYEYGGFSPWDTYRTLHPLLTLLYPDRQRDMLLSMEDQYLSSGYLPTESMTGNHSIPIIADSYLKGMRAGDSAVLYRAMRKSILDGPYRKEDMESYVQHGYIPHPLQESVTRTVEYCYDDWALAQYALKIMRDPVTAKQLMARSRNYRNLLDPVNGWFVPRKANEFYPLSANAGFKEGDKYVYSYAMPQYLRDMENLGGGQRSFADTLNTALNDNRLVFDNETMFHVPYLFAASPVAYKTDEWLSRILSIRFTTKPGGLPGNDDLGSLSSWYVWSALGLYPFAPGSPEYIVHKPVFSNVKLMLANHTELKLSTDGSPGEYKYLKTASINGEQLSARWLHHNKLQQGGELRFIMTNNAAQAAMGSPLPGDTDDSLQVAVRIQGNKQLVTTAGQPFEVGYCAQNTGGAGTYIAQALADGKLIGSNRRFLKSGQSSAGTITCELFTYGKHTVYVNQDSIIVEVRKRTFAKSPGYRVEALTVPPFVRNGAWLPYRYLVQNRTGERKQLIIPVMINGKKLRSDTVMVDPGERQVVQDSILTSNKGLLQISVASVSARSRVWQKSTEKIVVDMPKGNTSSAATDISGFNHHGKKMVDGGYLDLPVTAGWPYAGNTLTMMAWVLDTDSRKPLGTILSQGDHNVMQLQGNALSFFAGGWGRGECGVDLPADWKKGWHHLAGVCTDGGLIVYLDGKIVSQLNIQEPADLHNNTSWAIGGNNEFPLERNFPGKITGVKILEAALSGEEIVNFMKTSKPEEK